MENESHINDNYHDFSEHEPQMNDTYSQLKDTQLQATSSLNPVCS